jgi:hypothetical protein
MIPINDLTNTDHRSPFLARSEATLVAFWPISSVRENIEAAGSAPAPRVKARHVEL